MTVTAPKSKDDSPPTKRRAARLAAVQALYQMRATDAASEDVIEEFSDHRLGKEIDGIVYAPVDRALFADIVRGTDDRSEEIDKWIETSLAKGEWRLDRLERIMLVLLQAGTYELLGRPDVPSAVVIDEYVELAHAFFGDREARFVNAVLDGLARDVRTPQEPRKPRKPQEP